ncbi:FtsX-like permease family protein [Lachnospiraceae bacterium]|nr:FtsX-like permease family protein [Lachnospiraceae bacterium]
MNVTQRALLYISHKKGKTVSLFLVVFVVAVLLVSCFGVLNASERLSRDIRTSLGAAFYIRANTEVSMNENGETQVKENKVHISQKEIDEIMQTGEIKYYNPINYGFAKSDTIQFIQGDKHTAENNMGKVTALRFSALAPNFADETAFLAEGRHITETDSGKILISEQLASANQISVGDTLTLTHAKLGGADGAYIDEIPVKTAYARVEVSGIYKLNIEDTSIKPTAGVADNEIYASIDVLKKLHESKTGIYTGEVDFYITDPAKLENIARNVTALQSIDWTTHFIRTNDFQYSKIADQLSSLGDLVKILLVLVSVISTAFLTLLLTMRMRSRMQEAGILLAVGVSKGQIMAGFLLEVLSVTIIALILSHIASLCVTGFLGHSLFGELQPNLLNEETLTAGMQNSLQIENYLKLSTIETLLIYICQFAVIAVSTLVSSVVIMRLKPKEILSKMS